MPSWVAIPRGSDFPIENLPYGVFSPPGGAPRVGVAIGDRIVDLARLSRAGVLDGTLEDPVTIFASESLNGFLALDPERWRATRERLTMLLRDENSEIAERAGLADDILVAQADATLHLPIEIADYVDFYSSIEHATNVGKIFRPGGEPLTPNYRWLPIGYHGRASSIVVSGTDIPRPCGQTKGPDDAAPRFGPSRQLDFELELGFITGDEDIFGVVLVNDWSARDIQAWENQPLGPFLSKSFATSISPWVVPLDALEPYRVENRLQEPPALEHLRVGERWAFDIELAVELQTGAMAERLLAPVAVTQVNFRGMYWNMAQQLAHIKSNGSRIRAGDLYASGTISGSEPGTYGSLIETTWRGTRPLRLPSGERRAFLEDGDTVIMRGAAERPGLPRIGLGEVRGTILP